MSELNEECGIAAIYYLGGAAGNTICPAEGPSEITRLLPRMLLDIQNRGQLAAGVTTYNPQRDHLLDTYKELGTVAEVFRLAHRGKVESLMSRLAGPAGALVQPVHCLHPRLPGDPLPRQPAGAAGLAVDGRLGAGELGGRLVALPPPQR